MIWLWLGCGSPTVTPATLETDAVEAASNLPDIVLVTLGGARADRVGFVGDTSATTPNLDRLAARGRAYRQAYAPAPESQASHAALFTGKYAARLGIRYSGGGRLDADAVTLAEILHEAGYETAGVSSSRATSRIFGFDQGFDAYDEPSVTAGWSDVRPGGAAVDWALDWKAKPHQNPVFLWVNLEDAQAPHAPPSPFREQHPGEPYAAELAYVDHQLGRLVDAFADRPAIFVVVGDHGEGLGDHGEASHGWFVYPSTQHVPFVIAGPGVEPGTVDPITSLVDVLPTTLAVAGVPLHAEIDGQVSPGDPRAVFVESYALRDRFGLSPQVGVLDGVHLLVDATEPELYDLVADPAAAHNLAKQQPDRVVALRKRLVASGLPPAPLPRPDDESIAYGDVAGWFSGDLGAGLPAASGAARWLAASQDAERLRASGDNVGSANVLGRLSKDHPDVVEFRVRWAEALFASDDVAAAEPVMDDVLQVEPRNPWMRAAKANLLARRGRLGDAATIYRQLAEELPYAAEFRMLAVAALLASDDTEAAGLALADTLVKAHPDDAAVAGVLGVHHYTKDKFELAIPLLVASSKAELPPPQVCFALASLERGRGRAHEALALLIREFDLYPAERDVGLALLQEANEQRDWARTAKTAERLVALNPGDAAVWHARAQAWFNAGDLGAAREALDAGRALHPDSPDLWMLDANLLVKEGHPDAAQASFERATALRRAQPAAAPAAVPRPSHVRPWDPASRPTAR